MIEFKKHFFEGMGFLLIRIALKKLKKISPQAYFVLKGGIMTGTATMLGSAVLIIAYHLTYITYYLRCSEALAGITFAVMFEAVFGSAFIEEYIRKHS